MTFDILKGLGKLNLYSFYLVIILLKNIENDLVETY